MPRFKLIDGSIVTISDNEVDEFLSKNPSATQVDGRSEGAASQRLKVRKERQEQRDAELQELENTAVEGLNKARNEEDYEQFVARKAEEKKKRFDKGYFNEEERAEYEAYRKTGKVSSFGRFTSPEKIFLDPENKTLQEEYKAEQDVKEREYMDNLPDSVRKNVLAKLQKENDNEIALDAFQRSYNTIDKVNNTLANAAVDIGLGAMYLLDMAKDDEGKENSFSKNLLAKKQELEKERAEKLPKAISLDNINSVSALGDYVGDAFINFLPSAAALTLGPAALPAFGIMGASGKLSQFAVEEAEAEKYLPELEKALRNPAFAGNKKEIQEQIERYNKILTTNNLTKLGTAAIYAGSEMIFERLGTLTLLNDLKQAAKLGSGYKEGIAKAILKTPQGTLREGVTEGLTQISQNASDILIEKKNISLLDNVDEAAVQGALIGTGFGVATTSMLARAHILDVIASKKDKQNIANGLKTIQDLNNDLQNPEISKETKLQIKNSINKKIKELSLNEDIISDRFLKLSKAQQKEVFELDRKSREINKQWISIASDRTISESTKDIMEQDLRTEFDNLQQAKRDIIQSADNRYNEIAKIKGLKEGDEIINRQIASANLRNVKQYNKGPGWAKKVIGVTGKDLENINNFLESKENSLTLEDKSVITKKEANEIINNSYKEYEDGSLQGKDGFFSRETKNVVVFTDIAGRTNPAVAIHEYLHAALDANGIAKEQFDNIKEDLIELIKNKAGGEITQQQANNILNKVATYDTALQSEELLTSISDFINRDIIKESDVNFLTKVRDAIKGTIAKLIGRGDANEFKMDTAQEAFDFVKSFNRKIVKGTAIEGKISTEPTKEDGVAGSNIVELYNKYNKNAKNLVSQSFLKTPQGEETFDVSNSEFGQAIGGLVETITKRLYDPVPQDLKRDISRNDFKNDLISEAGTIISTEFDPTKQDIGKFTTSRLNLRANRLATQRFGQQVAQDVTEAKSITTEQAEPKEITKAKDTLKSLGFENLSNEIDSAGERAIINAENKLKGTEKLSASKRINIRNKAFNEIIQSKIAKDIKDLFGKNTATSKSFTDFLNNNFEVLRDIALDNINFKKGKGETLNWNQTPPSKQEFIDYYIAEGQNNSTRSDRKLKLQNAVIQEISTQQRKKIKETQPEKAQQFEDETGIILASFIDNKNLGNQIGYTSYAPNFNIQAIRIYGKPKTTTVNIKGARKKIFANAIKAAEQIEKLVSLSPNIIKRNETDFRIQYKGQDKELVELNENTRNYLTEQRNKIFKKYGNKAIRPNKKPTKQIGNTFSKAKNWFNKNDVSIYNNTNKETFNTVTNELNNILSKPENKELGNIVYWILNNSVDNRETHFFPNGAEVVSLSKKGKPGEIIVWEHAVENTTAYKFLFPYFFKPKKEFLEARNALLNNFKQAGLSQEENKLQDKKRKRTDFNVFEDSWTSIYKDAGINLQNQEWVAPGKNQYEGVQASNILDTQFNELLEKVKGVKAEARYSDARAAKLGAKRNPFKFFVPYSAEDYMGLIYPTLGKGKVGDENLKWYKKNIIDPYARGVRDFESAKQVSLNSWADLKKQLKNTPARLNKEAVRDFTNEEAIRLYLWNQQNMLPEGVAKKDIDAITKYIEGNKNLLDFTNQIQSLTPDGYPAPSGSWLAGTITTDLVDYTNTVKRGDYLKEWQDNVDVVYSKDNLNKLQALYGDNYVEALQDMLYRMKTGRNRPIGGNKLTNQYLNWVNNSVGGIMFFNTRSALLQTISAVNYVNFTDNNPLRVAKAFANQPQFWKDFSTIFNSDFLKSRRSGLKTDVNADEIARTAATAENKFRAGLAYLLKKGFIPTQYADSFAISFGGATFLRNRIDSLKKEGMTEQQAEEQAFLDFKEITEESQQSSRPDRVSMQQASPLGRVILAFANTPMQYTRLTKKAALDLINKRGDWKTNLSKLVYYGAVQNIIFSSLQSALFALAFSDEEDKKEKQKYIRIANNGFDTLLRGSGVHGAAVAMAKNIVLEAIKQAGGRKDFEKAALQITTLSPPIDSKIKKLMSAGRTFKYKQEIEKMKELPLYDINNPALMATGRILSATANIPLDRALQKAQNLKLSVDDDTEMWQSIALALGYNKWDLNMQDPIKEKKKKPSIVDLRNAPLKKLENLPNGVLGKAHKDGTIQIRKGLSTKKKAEVLKHEKQHVKDMKSGRLNYDQSYVYWEGKKYPRTSNKKIIYNGKALPEGHGSFPWERAANKAV